MVSRIGDELKTRALWLSAPRTAELREETVPSPGPGEIRVETIASAVSAGTELLVYRGEVPQDLPLDLPTLAGRYAFPIKYGYAAGYVLDTGSGVDHLAPGDPVFVHHPHQDVFLVPARMSVRLRDDLDRVLGVFATNLEIALTVVHDTPLRLGDTALIFGDPMLRVRMSAAATRRASRLPRWEHTVIGFEQILRIVAETRKSGWR